MPLEYGYLKALVATASRLVGPDARGEYHLHVTARPGTASSAATWDVAINVGSSDPADRLKYRLASPFSHAMQATLRNASLGWHDLTGSADVPAVDFLRSDVLAGTGSWGASDVMDGSTSKEPYAALARLLDRAKGQPHFVYAFGRPFAHAPPLGVHDIHMNQGSTGNHQGENAPWQDGALLVDLPEGCVGYFSAFTKQFVPTNGTGSPTSNARPIGDRDVASLAGAPAVP